MVEEKIFANLWMTICLSVCLLYYEKKEEKKALEQRPTYLLKGQPKMEDDKNEDAS